MVSTSEDGAKFEAQIKRLQANLAALKELRRTSAASAETLDLIDSTIASCERIIAELITEN